MFRKFLASAYTKAALTMLVCGGLLILFSDWVKNNQISLGFETINKALAPVYVGVVLAFIVCPVYNACVRFAYERMLDGASRKTVGVGSMIVHAPLENNEIGKDEKRSMLTSARVFATVISVLLVTGILGLLIYFVVPQLVQNCINLANTMPQRLASLSAWLKFHFSGFPILAKWVDNLANAGTNDIVKWIQEHLLSKNAVSIAGMVSSGVVAAVKYVGNAFVGLLIMIYLLNYKERLFAITRKFVAATFSKRVQDNLYEFAGVVNETFIGFIVGRIIDSFIIGVLTFIAMSICGISFPLMISVIIGVTNVIPFFGPFIGAIPSIFLLLLERPVEAFYFLIIILLIQQLDGNVIGPKIVGNALGISSFWVLIAVLIGGGLFGFYGMALGVPVFAVIYKYVDKLTTRSLRYKHKPSETKDYFNLDAYGIDDKEISLDPEEKKQESIISLIRRGDKRRLAAHERAKTESRRKAEELRRKDSDSESGE